MSSTPEWIEAARERVGEGQTEVVQGIHHEGELLEVLGAVFVRLDVAVVGYNLRVRVEVECRLSSHLCGPGSVSTCEGEEAGVPAHRASKVER